MQVNNLVVARFLDGRVLKGTTNDFSPMRPAFHVTRSDTGGVEEVRTAELKAVFFVHTLEGDPTRPGVRGFLTGPGETSQGRKIAVLFQDGELLCGYAQAWSPDRDGFFLFPADKESNNQRVFVRTAAAVEIQAGPAAESLVERLQATTRPG